MKTTSLENGFITLPPLSQRDTDGHLLSAYASLRNSASESLKNQADALAIADKLLATAQATDMAEENAILRKAAPMQIAVAALIEAGDYDKALDTAADTLTILSQEARRKDEEFLLILGCLLHDLAFIHNMRKEYKAAERTLTKSIKIFERLAKLDTERYGSAHINTLNASTSVYRSRIKQVNLLAHYQVATTTYLNMVNSGIKNAMDRLINSLQDEGLTLMQLGKYKDAIRYFSRAIKYLTKLQPDFSRRHMDLSVMLGEALLHNTATRQKGVHLLNTLLQKAIKSGEDDTAEKINGLLEKQSGRLDIIGMWHKIFPR